MSKTISRTFRLSSEVDALLLSAEGRNVSEKFEHLIYTAFQAVPIVTQERKSLMVECNALRERLTVLRSELYNLECIKRQLALLENECNHYCKSVSTLREKLEASDDL